MYSVQNFTNISYYTSFAWLYNVHGVFTYSVQEVTNKGV